MIKINKIDNYQDINKKLLFLIGRIPNTSLKQLNYNISHTDWNLPKEAKREYLDYFFQIIEPYMLKITQELKSKRFTISNAWFQQYYKFDVHPWHTHPDCQFTNVYFVELPLKSLGTEILDEEKLDLNEGDLLTFPSYLYHRSPINLEDKRKTIISFNSNFEECLY